MTDDTTKQCLECGKDLDETRASSNYCSSTCRAQPGLRAMGMTKKKSVSVTCQWCGEEITGLRPWEGKVRKFCSVTCSNRHTYHEVREEGWQGELAKQTKIVNCRRCGKEMEVKSQCNNVLVSCPECKVEGRREYHRKFYKLRRERWDYEPPKEPGCEWCGCSNCVYPECKWIAEVGREGFLALGGDEEAIGTGSFFIEIRRVAGEVKQWLEEEYTLPMLSDCTGVDLRHIKTLLAKWGEDEPAQETEEVTKDEPDDKPNPPLPIFGW